tara:strand:+ start:59 stop:1222 length:1164 start_codon:yes stop_codon:yes gene_type:complete
MNAGNASGYTKEQIKGMMGDTSSGNTGGNTSPRTKQNFLSGEDRYLSYPIARNNQEITGDTLRIKCLEYVPSDGEDFKVQIDNFFTEDVNKATGKVIPNSEKVPGKKERKKFFGENDVVITPTFTNADTRIRNASKQRKLTKYNIELPMPQEIQDSQSVTWGDDKINAIELAGVSAAGRILSQDLGKTVNDTRQAIEILNSGVNIPGVTIETQNAIRAALAGGAIGALGGNVSPRSIISRTTGQVLNNNLELLFNGVNLRTFPYSITFSPRNPDEGNVVKKIIRALKMSMSAKAGEFNQNAQGLFIKSPDLFQLQYLRDGKDHPFLNNFKLCALTGMNINYTNAGTYTSYSDGTPVNIRMDVTFKEINPVYAEDYLPGNGSGMGVGF